MYQVWQFDGLTFCLDSEPFAMPASERLKSLIYISHFDFRHQNTSIKKITQLMNGEKY